MVVGLGWGGCGNYETGFFRGNSQGFFLSEKGFGSGGRNMGRSKGKTREGGFLEKTVCSCCWKVESSILCYSKSRDVGTLQHVLLPWLVLQTTQTGQTTLYTIQTSLTINTLKTCLLLHFSLKNSFFCCHTL